MAEYGDIIDSAIFDQLLEMDDDNEREFSKGIAKEYIKQAETTLKELNESLGKKDFESLGRLGHFMKGSSAAVGLKKVRATCEQIQNCARNVDAGGKPLTLSSEEQLKKLGVLVPDTEKHSIEAEEWLKRFYKL
ncbi:hypothetical protein HDU98_011479 [Podochytrium sp. JEL0797]|nr:hypothetical protein HDU98_011479 [Podochytrium sp. JEL0797]